MDTKKTLLSLIKEAGGKKAFAVRVGLSEEMIFKVLSGERQFGRASATKIERAFPGRIDRRDLVWMSADIEAV